MQVHKKGYFALLVNVIIQIIFSLYRTLKNIMDYFSIYGKFAEKSRSCVDDFLFVVGKGSQPFMQIQQAFFEVR